MRATVLVFLVPVLVCCAKEIRGAGSASVAPSVSEVVQFALPDVTQPDMLTEPSDENGFRFGVGASNLRPYFLGTYTSGDLTVGGGFGGILFSGLRIDYAVGTADISFIQKYIKGRRSFLGFGLGAGGVVAHDYNWSRPGRKTNLLEGRIYGQMHITARPSGAPFCFLVNLKIGAFYLNSPVFLDIADELIAAGSSGVRKRGYISGLSFSPSIGFNWGMVENRVISYVGLTVPLTTFLIFEPDFHPYVPSFNFAFMF